ncbi:DUF6519 domain-containing protein [Micromonospora sp. CPCC 205739]|uniref:DUF6519 domain-containing protein n=1 Tax=Micromonospora sp. CPCC 205739 TaxID=3122404 RepID=UPI002FF436C3
MTIRNDATRLTLRPADQRRPRSVVPRQGQVLLDADIDQQATHLLDRVETGAEDTFGSGGRLVVPARSTGFLMTPAAKPSDCEIGPGHGYLGGWLVENVPGKCALAKQPHPRDDSTPAVPFILALKALVRHVDPVEEPAFADPALGDAQASGRALVDWQVFPFAPKGGWAKDPETPSCASVAAEPEWKKLVAPSTGTLAVIPDSTPPEADPCSLASAGGYSRSENLLYRIEVHGGSARTDFPTAEGPRYGLKGLKVKMSRRNASVMALITGVSGTEVTVEPPSLDPLNWFAPGAYAEVVSVHDDIDPRSADKDERLFRVALATDTVVTLESAATALLTAVNSKEGWYLRLWDAFPDGDGVATVKTDTDPNRSQAIDLGDGLKVQLGAGSGGATAAVFRRGDYWTFAARADGTVDWPSGSPETPHGPVTRYAPLAVLTGSATALQAEDCRIPLATLTDRALLYRGGDGQGVPAPPEGGFVPLPARLRVAVMRGKTPVARATVRWSVPDATANPECRIDGRPVGGRTTLSLTTGADGLCDVKWEINAGHPSALHQVQAELLAASGTTEGEPLVFTASFRTAAATSYEPGACKVLAEAKTVQEALDQLCLNLGGRAEPETLEITSIRLVDREKSEIDLVRDEFILNGIEVPFDAFTQGIGIGVTGLAIKARPQEHDPIVEVELDLPYPTTDFDRRYWAMASRSAEGGPGITGPFGFRRVRLDGSVGVLTKGRKPFEAGLVWAPSPPARIFLETIPSHRCGYTLLHEEELKELGWEGNHEPPRVLCRVRIRSAHVWATAGRRERVYLNAEHLGIADGATGRELLRADRDPQRAADLDLFFYLAIGDADARSSSGPSRAAPPPRS